MSYRVAFGDSLMQAAYIGDHPVAAMYLGDNLIFPYSTLQLDDVQIEYIPAEGGSVSEAIVFYTIDEQQYHKKIFFEEVTLPALPAEYSPDGRIMQVIQAELSHDGAEYTVAIPIRQAENKPERIVVHVDAGSVLPISITAEGGFEPLSSYDYLEASATAEIIYTSGAADDDYGKYGEISKPSYAYRVEEVKDAFRQDEAGGIVYVYAENRGGDVGDARSTTYYRQAYFTFHYTYPQFDGDLLPGTTTDPFMNETSGTITQDENVFLRTEHTEDIDAGKISFSDYIGAGDDVLRATSERKASAYIGVFDIYSSGARVPREASHVTSLTYEWVSADTSIADVYSGGSDEVAVLKAKSREKEYSSQTRDVIITRIARFIVDGVEYTAQCDAVLSQAPNVFVTDDTTMTLTAGIIDSVSFAAGGGTKDVPSRTDASVSDVMLKFASGVYVHGDDYGTISDIDYSYELGDEHDGFSLDGSSITAADRADEAGEARSTNIYRTASVRFTLSAEYGGQEITDTATCRNVAVQAKNEMYVTKVVVDQAGDYEEFEYGEPSVELSYVNDVSWDGHTAAVPSLSYSQDRITHYLRKTESFYEKISFDSGPAWDRTTEVFPSVVTNRAEDTFDKVTSGAEVWWTIAGAENGAVIDADTGYVTADSRYQPVDNLFVGTVTVRIELNDQEATAESYVSQANPAKLTNTARFELGQPRFSYESIGAYAGDEREVGSLYFGTITRYDVYESGWTDPVGYDVTEEQQYLISTHYELDDDAEGFEIVDSTTGKIRATADNPGQGRLLGHVKLVTSININDSTYGNYNTAEVSQYGGAEVVIDISVEFTGVAPGFYVIDLMNNTSASYTNLYCSIQYQGSSGVQTMTGYVDLTANGTARMHDSISSSSKPVLVKAEFTA